MTKKCSIEESSISERDIFLLFQYKRGESMCTNLSFDIIFRNILLSGFKYRDRAKIIVDILDSVSSEPKGKTKTSIMRSANLNLDQVNTYLFHLVSLGLIKSGDPLKSQEMARYKVTTKGLKLVKDIDIWRYVLAPSQKRPV